MEDSTIKQKRITNYFLNVALFILLIIFVIGYRLFTYNLSFAGIFAGIFTTCLVIIISLEKDKYWKLLWLVGLLTLIILQPKLWKLPEPFPKETDRNIFTLGMATGTACDRLKGVRGEVLLLSQLEKYSQKSLLNLLGYQESEQFVEKLSDICERAESEKKRDNNYILLSKYRNEMADLIEPVKSHIIEHYGIEGISIFQLGNNIVSLYREMLMIQIIDFASLPLAEKKVVERYLENLIPQMDFFRSLRFNDAFFPNNLRDLIVAVSQIDVSDFSQLKKLLDLSCQISSVFGMYLQMKGNVNDQINSQLSIDLSIGEIKNGNFDNAINMLNVPTLTKKPEVHFLMAKAYLKKTELKSLNFAERLSAFNKSIREINLFLLMADIKHDYRKNTSELYNLINRFQKDNKISTTVNQLESLRKCHEYLSRKKDSIMLITAYKIVDSTVIETEDDYYYHVISLLYIYLGVNNKKSKAFMVAPFFDCVCSGLENYIILAPNGKYNSYAKRLINLVRCDSSEIKNDPTTDEGVSKRLRTEQQINDSLLISNFGIASE